MKKCIKLIMLFFAAVAVSSCNNEDLEPGLSAPVLNLFGVVDDSGVEQNINDGKIVILPSDSKGYSLTVKANDWWNARIECEGDQQWATIASNETAGGSTPTSINVVFTDNINFDTRSALLTFSTEPSYNGAVAKVSFKLVQAGASEFVVTNVNEDNGLPMKYAADLDTAFIASSNASFTAEVVYPDTDPDKDWLEVTPDSFTAGMDQTVTVKTLRLNGTGAVRAAIVRLTTAGTNGDAAVYDINVTQDFLVQKLEATETIPDEGLQISVPANIKDTVKITSNVPFTASVVYQDSDPDKDWLAVGQANYDAGEGVKVGFNTLTTNSTGSDRWATLHFATTGEFGTPITFDVKVTQIGEVQPVTLAKTNQFNGDSICVYWTGDVAYDKYKVVVTEQGNESNVLATIEVEKPADVTNQTEFHVNLSKNSAVSAFNGNITAKVVPVFTGNIDGTPSATVSGNAQWADGTGDGSSAATPITIANTRHLLNMHNKLDGYFQLAADFTADAVAFVPVGQKDTPFTGQFDGNSKTITGLKLRNNNAGSGSTGLFGHISSTAVVKNFTIADPDFEVITPGSSDNPTYKFDKTLGHGVVVGFNDGGLIDGVTVNASSRMQFPGAAMSGGIAGVNTNKAKITNCHVKGTGDMRVTNGKFAVTSFGGIVGVNYGNETGGKNVNIDWDNLGIVDHCSNSLNIVAATQGYGSYTNIVAFGGIVGLSDGQIDYCYNTGNVVASATNVILGGIIGSTLTGISSPTATLPALTDNITYASVIRYCFNSGTIESSATLMGMGGIAGVMGVDGVDCKNGNAFIQESYNSGDVKCTKSGGPARLGGLVGVGYRLDIKDAYCQGSVTSADNAQYVYLGGLVGEIRSLVRAYDSYVAANISVDATGATYTKSASAFYGTLTVKSGSVYQIHDNVYVNKDLLPAQEVIENTFLVSLGRFAGFTNVADKNTFVSGADKTGFASMKPYYSTRTEIDPIADVTDFDKIEAIFYKTTAEMQDVATWSAFDAGKWNKVAGSYPTLKNVVTAN